MRFIRNTHQGTNRLDRLHDRRAATALKRVSSSKSLFALVLAIAVIPGGLGSAVAQDAAVLSPETANPPTALSTNQLPGSVAIDRNQPLYLQGDELIYDSRGDRVTARGNVEIFYNDFVLTADEVVYDQSTNTLTAAGNVTLRDPNGSITRSERIVLTDDFRDGFVQSLSIETSDRSRITARRAIRRDGNVTEFEDGKFTPCQTDDGKPPLWCVSAQSVIHDQNAGTITYFDATFDILGQPVVYLPYFQHADPSVKRKSGFLIPQYTSSEDLGFGVEIPYYFALAPNFDFTFHPMYAARQGVLLKGTWRHKLAFGQVRGQYNLKLAGIDQNSNDLPNNDPKLDGWRGSIQTRGDFSLSSWWRLGWDAIIESDDSFRRFYKLDNILQTDRVNTIHLTGLSDRNHFRMQSYQFGGLLLTDSDVAESRVHPIIDWNYIVGMPVLGGELSWNVNALSFSRDQSFTNYQYDKIDKTTKTQRIVADINWRRKFTDGIGISYTPFANLRGDALTYDNAVDPLKNRLIDESTVTRGIATAGLLASYPWLASGSRGSHIIEPIGQVIARTGKVEQRDLPNEDARSIVFDDTNLFEFNKTSGLDRVETGTRANVGLQYTFQAYSGGHARILAGQSFHLSGDNIYNGFTGVEPSIDPKTASSILAPNNGLQNDSSDYVLGAYVAPSDVFTLVGQGRFDHNDLQLQRADVAADFRYGPLNAQAIYTFAAFDPTGGRYDLEKEKCDDPECLTKLSDAYKTRLANELLDQQDLIGTVSLQLSERWRIIGATRFDIDKREGRQNSVSLRYADDCFVLTTTYTQSNIEDPNRDITRDQTILLRFELKHIGEFSYRSDALDHLFGENQANF